MIMLAFKIENCQSFTQTNHLRLGIVLTYPNLIPASTEYTECQAFPLVVRIGFGDLVNFCNRNFPGQLPGRAEEVKNPRANPLHLGISAVRLTEYL
jgi:hypothetical protein